MNIEAHFRSVGLGGDDSGVEIFFTSHHCEFFSFVGFISRIHQLGGEILETGDGSRHRDVGIIGDCGRGVADIRNIDARILLILDARCQTNQKG